MKLMLTQAVYDIRRNMLTLFFEEISVSKHNKCKRMKNFVCKMSQITTLAIKIGPLSINNVF